MIWLALRSPVNGGCQSDKGASFSWEYFFSLSLSLSVHFLRESQVRPVCTGALHSTSPQKEPHYQLVKVTPDALHTRSEMCQRHQLAIRVHAYSCFLSNTTCTFKKFCRKTKAFALYGSHCFYFIHTYSQIATYTQMRNRTAWDSFPFERRGCMGRFEPTSLIGSHGLGEAVGLSGTLWVPGGLLWRVSSPEGITMQFHTHTHTHTHTPCVKHLNWSVDVWITNALYDKKNDIGHNIVTY